MNFDLWPLGISSFITVLVGFLPSIVYIIIGLWVLAGLGKLIQTQAAINQSLQEIRDELRHRRDQS